MATSVDPSPWETLRFRRSKDIKGWVLLGIPQSLYPWVIQSLFERQARFIEKCERGGFVNVSFEAPVALAALLALAFPAPPGCETLSVNAAGDRLLYGKAADSAKVRRQAQEGESNPRLACLGEKEEFWDGVIALAAPADSSSGLPAQSSTRLRRAVLGLIPGGVDEEGFEQDPGSEEEAVAGSAASGVAALGDVAANGGEVGAPGAADSGVFEDIWETEESDDFWPPVAPGLVPLSERLPESLPESLPEEPPERLLDPELHDSTEPMQNREAADFDVAPLRSGLVPHESDAQVLQSYASGGLTIAEAIAQGQQQEAQQPQRRRIELPFETAPPESSRRSPVVTSLPASELAWSDPGHTELAHEKLPQEALAWEEPAWAPPLDTALLPEPHLDILRQGVAAWNAWRQAFPRLRPELRGAYLDNLDLQGVDLRGADLQGAFLFRADLRGADLSLASLMGADLIRADLEGALLWGACLAGAYLNYANLAQADLTQADVRGAFWQGTILQGAIMPNGQWFEVWAMGS